MNQVKSILDYLFMEKLVLQKKQLLEIIDYFSWGIFEMTTMLGSILELHLQKPKVGRMPRKCNGTIG